MLLNPSNYTQGFLVDEELMGGVSTHPEKAGRFIAFVIRHTTGEYLGCQPFDDLQQALHAINSVQRSWKFEKSSGCGGCADGSCGKEGGCSRRQETGSCGLGGACSTSAPVSTPH
jgi:hypothetical protein